MKISKKKIYLFIILLNNYFKDLSKEEKLFKIISLSRKRGLSNFKIIL